MLQQTGYKVTCRFKYQFWIEFFLFFLILYYYFATFGKGPYHSIRTYFGVLVFSCISNLSRHIKEWDDYDMNSGCINTLPHSKDL